MSAAYMAVLGERDALSWVVREQRMAFPRQRLKDAQRLAVGDRLFLYATRGAFHSPTRDRGRIFGEAEVATRVNELNPPLELASRQFTSVCRLRVLTLAPMRHGIELAPLVSELSVFPDERSWPVRIRRALVPLTEADAVTLRSELNAIARPPSAVLETYAL
jgi:hypothetical protein